MGPYLATVCLSPMNQRTVVAIIIEISDSGCMPHTKMVIESLVITVIATLKNTKSVLISSLCKNYRK